MACAPDGITEARRSGRRGRSTGDQGRRSESGRAAASRAAGCGGAGSFGLRSGAGGVILWGGLVGGSQKVVLLGFIFSRHKLQDSRTCDMEVCTDVGLGRGLASLFVGRARPFMMRSMTLRTATMWWACNSIQPLDRISWKVCIDVGHLVEVDTVKGLFAIYRVWMEGATTRQTRLDHVRFWVFQLRPKALDYVPRPWIFTTPKMVNQCESIQIT